MEKMQLGSPASPGQNANFLPNFLMGVENNQTPNRISFCELLLLLKFFCLISGLFSEFSDDGITGKLQQKYPTKVLYWQRSFDEQPK